MKVAVKRKGTKVHLPDREGQESRREEKSDEHAERWAPSSWQLGEKGRNSEDWSVRAGWRSSVALAICAFAVFVGQVTLIDFCRPFISPRPWLIDCKARTRTKN